MSGIYRKLIGPALVRLENYLKAPPSHPTFDKDETLPNKVRNLHHYAMDLQTHINKITTTHEYLERQQTKWIDYIVRLSHGSATKEEALHDKYTTDTKLIETMNDAADKIEELNGKRRAVENEIKSTEKEMKPKNVKNNEDHNEEEVVDYAQRVIRQHVKLPKLEMRPFHGDITKYQEFMDAFTHAIDKQPIDNASKIEYLFSYLRADAYAATELRNLPPCVDDPRTKQPKLSQLRALYENIERICRQLEELGEDVSHPQIAFCIESKLPLSVLEELYKHKGPFEELDPMEMREKLNTIIETKEHIARRFRENAAATSRTPKQCTTFHCVRTPRFLCANHAPNPLQTPRRDPYQAQFSQQKTIAPRIEIQQAMQNTVTHAQHSQFRQADTFPVPSQDASNTPTTTAQNDQAITNTCFTKSPTDKTDESEKIIFMARHMPIFNPKHPDSPKTLLIMGEFHFS
ncbi:gag protein [Ditylenchus destructor]|uniref:Gag protein n=1 Tax=Ditylenchus destructor TaxID=166010 RepID=A0AAD4MNT9_9BILA|nr:gag protein [Ditylenchus destructor]